MDARSPGSPAAVPPGPVPQRLLSGAELQVLRVLARSFRAGDLARPLPPGPPAPARAPSVAASARLFEVVRLLADHPCVVVGGRARPRLITRGELQSLPGRIWLFGLVAGLEQFLMNRIQARWSGPEWSVLLSPGRLDKARELQSERARMGHPGTLADCLQLADKAGLLLQDPAERALLGFPSASAARKAVHRIESFRNHLVHAQGIADSHWAQITSLAGRIERLLGAGRRPVPAPPSPA